jgi:hypothetical protein
MHYRSRIQVFIVLGLMVLLPIAVWTQEKASTADDSQVPEPLDVAVMFYVAVTGSDANPGTLDAPWRTIQHAVDSVAPGATVNIRGGIYHESVDIEVSGSATAGPVTLQSYPGEVAILDGEGLTPPKSDIRGLVNIEDQSYVTVRGMEVRNYHTANAEATPAGIWVTGAGSHIQILDNLVHHIGTTAEAAGNALGIGVYGSGAPDPLDGVAISGNQVHDLKTGNSEAVVVSGNVTNFTITSNTVHDVDNSGIAAVGFEEVAPDPAIDYPRNGTIGGNTLYNVSAKTNPAENHEYNADGISGDGSSQVIVERNLLHNVDIGIEIASQHKGRASRDVIVRNNLVYHTNSVGITLGGSSLSAGGAEHCAVVNNTLLQNDTKSTGGGEFQIQYHAANNVFKNNIVSATSQGLFLNSYTRGGLEPAQLDYNLYFSPVSTAKAEFIWKGQDHEGFAAYQAAGGDRHSRYADPKFLSLETTDLRLQPGSPAVDAGIDLSGALYGELDFVGNPRRQGAAIDLGAYELQRKQGSLIDATMPHPVADGER